MLSLLPTTVFAVDGVQDATIVLACSDFQNQSCTSTNHQPGVDAVQGILNQIKADGYTTADGFICCGDYYKSGENNTTNSVNGLNALSRCVTDNFGSNVDKVFVQGNHDGKIAGIASTGAHDSDDYGVYVLDEDDYESYNVSLSKSNQLAANLTTYFNAKIQANYDKPVFVVSHVPLHAGTRTIWNGTNGYDNCALYAKPIFEAINAAAEDLNIIFLFGHNHSKDHDAFLGGSAIYLAKGDNILIADGTGTKSWNHFTTQTLNFTYLNAGYVGYYEDYSNADNALTMTAFAIDGNQVTISRYDANGLHVLKHAGAHTTYRDNGGRALVDAFVANVPANTDVYNSPQTVSLNTTNPPVDPPVDPPVNPPVDPEPEERTFTDTLSGISVTAKSGAELIVDTLSNSATFDNIAKYNLYNIAVTGFEQEEAATVSIPVPADYNAEQTCVYRVNGNVLENMNAVITDDVATFTTNSFGNYMVAENGLPDIPDTPDIPSLNWEEVIVPGETHYNYTLDTDGVDNGGHYLIVAPNADMALADNGSASGYSNVLTKPVIINGNVATVGADAYALADWTIGANGTVAGPTVTTGTTESYKATTVTANNNNYTLSNPGNYYYVTSDGQYHRVTSATCTRSGWMFWLSYNWTIRYEGGSATANTQSITLYTVTSTPVTAPSTYDAWYLQANRGVYLKLGTGASGDFSYDTTAAKIVIHANGNTGLYQLIRYYNSSANADLMYNGGWATDKVSNGTNYAHPTAHYVRLYKYTGMETIAGERYYLAMDGENSFTFDAGEYTTQAALEQYLRNAIAVYQSNDGRDDNKTAVDYDIIGTVNPMVAGTTTLHISCDGKNWPITVTIVGKTVASVTVDKSGSVRTNASSTTSTGSTLIIAYTDGSRDTVPIKLNMVSGNYNIKKKGTYRNLTVSYDGYTVGGYTLQVK